MLLLAVVHVAVDNLTDNVQQLQRCDKVALLLSTSPSGDLLLPRTLQRQERSYANLEDFI